MDSFLKRESHEQLPEFWIVKLADSLKSLTTETPQNHLLSLADFLHRSPTIGCGKKILKRIGDFP
jgi:hypothetical protein